MVLEFSGLTNVIKIIDMKMFFQAYFLRLRIILIINILHKGFKIHLDNLDMVLKKQYVNTTNIVDTSLFYVQWKIKSSFFKARVLMSNVRINSLSHDFHV